MLSDMLCKPFIAIQLENVFLFVYKQVGLIQNAKHHGIFIYVTIVYKKYSR